MRSEYLTAELTGVQASFSGLDTAELAEVPARKVMAGGSWCAISVGRLHGCQLPEVSLVRIQMRVMAGRSPGMRMELVSTLGLRKAGKMLRVLSSTQTS